ncbi:valine--tRNA ligase [bacterium]|nr:valine--tRNA ligase [bacterium]
MDLKPKYDHLEVEKGKYQEWLKKDLFKSGDKSRDPFTIVIPPPNVTGILHIGHAYDFSLQDIIIRRKRMQGYDCMYLPGMDHAGIATQAKVDKKLKDQGISRYDIGREKFLEVAWEWKYEYAKVIRDQWASLGLSLDYKHERFTLDEKLNKTVIYVFKTLYDKGLIYHGKRIISWDTEAETALSNIEIIHEDTKAYLYYIKYPYIDRKGSITVATTRPETMFADTAVMVNPKDKRYKNAIGKHVRIPATDTIIPVIEDSYVDMKFGTGAVKVTPAHDPNDYEVGKRHKLKMPIAIDKKGQVTELGGKYKGLDRFIAREQLVKDLDENGYLLKKEEIVHAVGYSERTGSMVEPMLSEQWFVKMKPLAKQALKKSKVNFYPERFRKTWEAWMENCEDWCISRQLWWGHRIPVYYRGSEIYVGEKPEGQGWIQDEDVLDTWFSSALWPFSTLDYLDNSELYQRRFPTDTLVTGYDIIFFWVSRMIFDSLEFTGQDPFKDVVIHGLVRDAKGRKMSKSLGNGVDPIKEIEKYGCDTVRYFLTTSVTMGLDLKYEEEKVKSCWNYLNKIWNISRYCLNTIGDIDPYDINLKPTDLNTLDKWVLTKLNEVIEKVNYFMDRYEFGEASRYIYNFVYDDFASIYLELSKINPSRLETKKVLLKVLVTILKLLHPFTPFITEDIYLKIYPKELSISIQSYPIVDEHIYNDDKKSMDLVIDLIKRVRVIRNENGVSLSKPIELLIQALNDKTYDFIMESKEYLIKFLNPSPLSITKCKINITDAVSIISDSYKAYIPMSHLVDTIELKNDLLKKLEDIDKELERSNNILSNENFLNKAPEVKIKLEKDKLLKYQETKKHLIDELKKIENV